MRYKGKTKELFFDYVNNFLTVQRCADYYGISTHSLGRLVRYWKRNAWAHLGKEG